MRHPLILGLVLIALPALADHHESLPPGPRGEAVEMLAGYEKKLVQLLDAIPAETMVWRPGEGVRSFTEVFAHVTDANYAIPSLIGVDPGDAWSRDRRFEGRVRTKDQLREALPESFAHLRAAILAMTDESMDEEVPWFGDARVTRRAALFNMVKHIAEHEGQLVAYTRVNGLVPPWSE